MTDDTDNIFEKFYNKALEFLSYRTRSEKEIRDKLKAKQVEPQVIEKIIAKLKEKKFINDENFARQWIENRSRFKPRSLRLIKLELKQKGISEEVMEKISNDEFLIFNDLEQAKKLVEKRIKRLKDLSKQEIYQKLGRYLASKGFNWDTIKKAIDEVLDKGV
jgi:regulatory protein